MNKVGKFLIACSILGFVRGIFALGNPKGSNYFGPIFFSAFVIGIIGFILYKTGKSSSKKDKITKNKQVDIEHKETFLRNNKNESTNHSNEKIDIASEGKSRMTVLDHLKKLCNPINFMSPYDSIKVEKANSIYPKILNCDPENEFRIKQLRKEAESLLGIIIPCDDLYNDLLEKCNPSRFANPEKYDAEKVSKANSLYQRILIYKNNYDELEELKEEAIAIGIIDDNKQKNEQSTNIVKDSSTVQNTVNIEESNESSSHFASIVMGIVFIPVLFALFWACFSTCNSNNKNTAQLTIDNELESTEVLEQVEQMLYNSPNGDCYYWTGTIKDNRPYGYGTATFLPSDKLHRNYYKGYVVYGSFHTKDNGQDKGVAYLYFQDGEHYEGVFVNSVILRGSLYKPNKDEYFLGTFQNNEPYNGRWYTISTNKYKTTITKGKKL